MKQQQEQENILRALIRSTVIIIVGLGLLLFRRNGFSSESSNKFQSSERYQVEELKGGPAWHHAGMFSSVFQAHKWVLDFRMHPFS